MKKIIRKIAGILTAAAFAFLAVALPDTGILPRLVVPASADYSGTGTESDPYLVDTWADLQAALNEGGYVKLVDSVVPYNSTDTYLSVPSGKTVTLDLNGFTINRNNPNNNPNNTGYVIKVEGNLTLNDSQGNPDTEYNVGKIIGGYNTSSYGGGGVYVNGGKFTMNGGTISDNKSDKYGGGVYVDGSGTFTMNDGTISSNKALNNTGGGVYIRNGTFTMNDGTISGNTGNDGGGVYVSSGTFNMTGGTISGNSAGTGGGGGVCVGGGTFTMTGGTISNNPAMNGGGVYVVGGTFNMTDGNISNNTASAQGGGVFVSGGKFNMTGGTISGNSAGNGGGVCVYNGKFTMIAGTISGNTALGRGGGVYVYTNFYLKNGVEVADDIYGTKKTIYTVTISKPTGGTVTATGDDTFTVGETTYSVNGDTVTLTTEPAVDYALKTLTVKQDETPVAVENGQFTMPAGDVTVSAEFAPLVTVTMGLAIFDGSEIGVDFGFTPADGEDVDDYTVEINGVSHTLASLETSGVYKTRVSMVAKKMRDPITVVVKKSGTIVKSVTTSIYDYSMIVLADNNYSAAHELIEAMLNYGAYSQLYFNYNTENLANEDIEDHTNFIDIKYNNLPIDKDEFNKFLESINAPVTYTGMNLTLESQTNLNLFFDLKNGHSSGELVDFISYISVFSCTYNIFSENDDTRLRIVMKEIPISNLYQQALIQFPGSNDSKTVSIDMYFKLAMEQGSDEVKLLCNALYNFFDKSRSYNPG